MFAGRTVLFLIMIFSLLPAAIRAEGSPDRRIDAAKKVLSNARTQMEMNAAAGDYQEAVEDKLLITLDKKLASLSDQRERCELLRDYGFLCRDIQKIRDRSWENTGSIEGMSRALEIAALMERMIEVMGLNVDDAARWKRIKSADGEINGVTLHLLNGKGEFNQVAYGEEVTLEIIIYPHYTFTRDSRDYAIAFIDLPGCFSNDYAAAAVLEFKDGVIVKAHCTGWEFELENFRIDGNMLILSGHDGKNFRIGIE